MQVTGIPASAQLRASLSVPWHLSAAGRRQGKILARSKTRGMELSDELWEASLGDTEQELELAFPTDILSVEQVRSSSS